MLLCLAGDLSGLAFPHLEIGLPNMLATQWIRFHGIADLGRRACRWRYGYLGRQLSVGGLYSLTADDRAALLGGIYILANSKKTVL
jgi:hypothetical protein